MTEQRIIDAITQGMFTIMATAAPPLVVGLVVGLIVSIFQTVTSIQEQTLAFVPKILAVLASIVIFGPFMLQTLTAFFRSIVTNLPNYVVPM